jgi:hypothetical protein
MWHVLKTLRFALRPKYKLANHEAAFPLGHGSMEKPPNNSVNGSGCPFPRHTPPLPPPHFLEAQAARDGKRGAPAVAILQAARQLRRGGDAPPGRCIIIAAVALGGARARGGAGVAIVLADKEGKWRLGREYRCCCWVAGVASPRAFGGVCGGAVLRVRVHPLPAPDQQRQRRRGRQRVRVSNGGAKPFE